MVRLTKLFVCIALLSGCAAQQATQHQASKPDEVANDTAVKTTQNLSIDFFSSFPSLEQKSQCQHINRDHAQCTEDWIPADYFYQVLSESEYFKAVTPSTNQGDYELLVASQTAISTPSWKTKVLSTLGAVDPITASYTHFTEFTLQWRGVEIDNYVVMMTLDGDTANDKLASAKALTNNWFKQVENRDLFSSKYLYQALEASDYMAQMELPSQIDQFKKSDMQLYPDPFKGAIARYTHPDYEEAILDITVYPIIQDLSLPAQHILYKELEQELADAELIAEARQLTLEQVQDVTPFHVHQQQGLVTSILAHHPEHESMFSTTYVFRMEDKIVKFSATFPPRVANQLIEQALLDIRVPQESTLMAELRKLSTVTPPTGS